MKTKGITIGDTFIILNGVEAVGGSESSIRIKYKNNNKDVVIMRKSKPQKCGHSEYGDLVVYTQKEISAEKKNILKHLNLL